MKGSKAAKRYAQGLFDLALEEGKLQEEAQDMQGISESIQSSRELRVFLDSPIYKVDAKTKILKATFEGVQPMTMQFLELITKQKRENLLGQMASSFIELYNEHENIQNVWVTTAMEMDAELNAEVIAKVKTLTDKKVNLHSKVDPQIVGGFIIRIGDREWNLSVADRFNKLRQNFNTNHYIPKY